LEGTGGVSTPPDRSPSLLAGGEKVANLEQHELVVVCLVHAPSGAMKIV
jgi:hypothetical protein